MEPSGSSRVGSGVLTERCSVAAIQIILQNKTQSVSQSANLFIKHVQHEADLQLYYYSVGVKTILLCYVFLICYQIYLLAEEHRASRSGHLTAAR